MRKILIVLLGLLMSLGARAGHIAGGEMYYRYIGPGIASGTFSFEISLRLFRECNPPPGSGGTMIAPMPTQVVIGVFNNGSPSSLFRRLDVNRTSLETITLSTPGACIVNAPPVCYQVGYYTTTIELPASPVGYLAAFQTCCRTNGIRNIFGTSVGATYTAVIPPLAATNTVTNSSAVFALKDTTLVCKDLKFTLDFSASDPDRDSLSYAFCAAYDGGDATDASARVPSNPPYGSIPYTAATSGSDPLGATVSINPKTGLISGTAPGAGSYVINVCVSEWRQGRIISTHRKDFTLKIGDCSVTEAKLAQPGYPTVCKSNAYTFENLSTSSNIATYFWEFFDPASGPNNTSTSPTPTHTYSDTGVYKVKLTVTSPTGCTDSSTSVVRVYPGFTADFVANGSCFLNPFSFADRTATAYGVVDKWRWDFGNTATTADTSVARNPTYKYDATGSYQVTLIAGSDKGCMDTVTKQVQVLNVPALSLPFKDTLICSIDSLPLRAIGAGAFSWLPNYNIVAGNTANPVVFPKQTTRYEVTLNENGCIKKDTITVNVVDFITVNAGADASLCTGDSVVLNPATEGLQFTWTPAAGLNNARAKTPRAAPALSTMYVLQVNLGKCQASDSVYVKVTPYPVANAGADTVICFGNRVNLAGNMVGSSFAWSPANTLQNSHTLAPVAAPSATTQYLLTVYDTLGCDKPFIDTVVVRVIPPVRAFAGNDTVIVANQPLQLNATGGAVYNWSPTFGMSNPRIANPVVTLGPETGDVRYQVRAETPEGCFGIDDINVRVFKTGPDIFIPTAFTPNRDGRNDLLKAIPVGMKSFEYLRIFNRWGQLVFSTGDSSLGWDGTLGGVDQPSGTFVYMAAGVDFNNRQVVKKGTLVLIR